MDKLTVPTLKVGKHFRNVNDSVYLCVGYDAERDKYICVSKAFYKTFLFSEDGKYEREEGESQYLYELTPEYERYFKEKGEL